VVVGEHEPVRIDDHASSGGRLAVVSQPVSIITTPGFTRAMMPSSVLAT
jgi:hypothetical protein